MDAATAASLAEPPGRTTAAGQAARPLPIVRVRKQRSCGLSVGLGRREAGKRTILQAWLHVLTLGAPLPTLPLWLGTEQVVPLNLEQSYEQACRDLWIA